MDTIRQKLNIVTALAAACTLLLTCASFFVSRWINAADAQIGMHNAELSEHDRRIAVNESRFIEIIRRLETIERKVERNAP